ncbi:MAG: DUF4124 domain-containing protein [Hahellaceae bacterium]|nr:DUF4124 domain-containing protein [Hahellaceae bacterium]MCP5168138.1 DUF4124 domain-containing protein [Hahellaceae bacterium]
MTKTMSVTRYGGSLLLLFLTLSVSAEVYKWRDEHGRTHYSDQPPSTGEVQTLTMPEKTDAHSNDPSGSLDNYRTRLKQIADTLQQSRLSKEKEQLDSERKVAERAKKCAEMAAQLKFMESISRFYDVNAQGERVFLSDDEGKKIRNKASDLYRQGCGG